MLIHLVYKILDLQETLIRKYPINIVSRLFTIKLYQIIKLYTPLNLLTNDPISYNFGRRFRLHFLISIFQLKRVCNLDADSIIIKASNIASEKISLFSLFLGTHILCLITILLQYNLNVKFREILQ